MPLLSPVALPVLRDYGGCRDEWELALCSGVGIIQQVSQNIEKFGNLLAPVGSDGTSSMFGELALCPLRELVQCSFGIIFSRGELL